MFDYVFSWLLIFVGSLCNSYTSMVVKWRFNQLGKMPFTSPGNLLLYLCRFFQSPLVLTAIITFLLSPIFWFTALSQVQLSIAIPVQFSMHLLLVLTFSGLVLKEKLSGQKMIGVAFILISLYFLYKS